MKDYPNSAVLVVDDEPGVRTALQLSFQRQGWRVETAAGAQEAIRKFACGPFPLVVTDVRMPDGNGVDVMHAVRNASPSTAVILLTAYGSVPEAVRAIRSGACDYLIKPVSFEQLRSAVERVMKQAGNCAELDPDCELVGRAPSLRRAIERARIAATTEADVLIEAESGTGKELLARYIHDMSDRATKSFVAVNCAAVPEQLLESELFGHAKGAFTGATAMKFGKFELANSGTLLLDEIGEMPLNLQPKLLRALQEREFERLGETRTTHVDIRVIATTNVSLRGRVEQGKFRADLYYRLNVIPLSLPPLRERREDIPTLAKFFAEKFAAQSRRPAQRLHPEFIQRLQAYAWPGNVRELLNYMRRVVALNQTAELGPECLDQEFLELEQAVSSGSSIVQSDVVVPGTPIRHLERQLLEKTLGLTDGNRTRAAEMLGISLRTIRNKIREYGLPPRRFA